MYLLSVQLVAPRRELSDGDMGKRRGRRKNQTGSDEVDASLLVMFPNDIRL